MGQLGIDELRHFGHAGYVLVPAVVPESLLQQADAEVDQLLERVEPDEGTGSA